MLSEHCQFNNPSLSPLPSETRTLSEALSGPHAAGWQDAGDDEYASLMEHQVWDLVPLPPGRKAVGCKWMFKAKQNSDGSLNRYKARLVAKGLNQLLGVDYNLTFAPVAHVEKLRCVLFIVASLDLEIHQMDIKTAAFLHGDLEEEIYMRQPSGYISAGHEGLVCRLSSEEVSLRAQAGTEAIQQGP